jgi:hypothetical protein
MAEEIRYVDFTEVVAREVQEGKVQVIHKLRSVIPEHVQSLSIGAIPSEIAGPGNTLVQKEATIIHFAGERITVKGILEVTQWKLAHHSKILKQPTKEQLEDALDKPKSNIAEA